MGQTSSHKHQTRNDFIKNSNLNPGNFNSGLGSGGGGGGGGGNNANFSPNNEYNYHPEELIEDEEVTINSKSSYNINSFILSKLLVIIRSSLKCKISDQNLIIVN